VSTKPRLSDVPPWQRVAYVAAVVGGFAVLVVDIVDRGAHWAPFVLFALILLMALLRPSGFWGRRRVW
jgi:branched-subunit amino acid ABC-type transport system permease component